MKKLIKLLITCILCIMAVGVLYFAGVLLYGTLSEFNPVTMEELTIENNQILNPDSGQISVLTWNIGYGGLGKEMDFFYEGGKLVRPSKQQSEKYIQGISQFLANHDSVDIMLLQEVDFKSKRSYQANELKILQEKLPAYGSDYAVNYKSAFVPVPFSEPMGKVFSGLAVFSKYKIDTAIRVATPGSHAWPKRLFTLKRCFVVNHIPIENSDKKLVVINVHNSAFGDEEEFRKAELKLLREYLLQEFEAGNYVIAGGDWNQNPPGFDNTQMEKYTSRVGWPIETDYLPPDWTWSWDPSLPTNRDVKTPFDLQATQCTILDYFVTSPNIDVLNIQTIDLDFENSDHQPVIINLKLI